MSNHTDVTGQRASCKLLSIEMVQEQLLTSRSTVNRLIAGGVLKTVRIGRSVRIPEYSLFEFIQSGGERHI